MAPLVRRTWAQLRDEAIACGGGHDYTGYSGRVEFWMEQAYYDICLSWHHYELEASATAAVLENDTSIPVPADLFVLMSLHRPNANGGLSKALLLQRTHFLVANFSGTAADPDSYCRFGSTVLLNCPVIAGAVGNWTFRYYKVPVAPDFTSGSPAINRVWDDHLIDATLARLQQRVWRPDLAGVSAQVLDQWIQQQVQPDMVSNIQANMPTLITQNRPTGGAQG
jgi:hypothetical protein